MRRRCTSEGYSGPWVRLKRKIGRDALAAVGWGACEELGVPIPDERARLNERRGGSKSDQDNHSRDDRNRRSRVHRNAQLAMVGIRVQRMHVRHLDNNQQRQQGQTHKSGCPESAWLAAAISADVGLGSCQMTIPNLKDTQYWTRQ